MRPARFASTGVEIEKSALFSTNSQELERTPSSAGNVDKWTFSTWVYFNDSTNSTSIPIFGAYQNSSNQNAILISNTGQIYFQIYLGGHVGRLKTTQLLRDTAFYHIVVVYDSGNAVAGNREIIYLNGERVTDFATETYVSQNQDGLICGTHLHQVGLFDGLTVSGNLYMAETVLLDNTATTPTSFGELSDDGYWTPLDSNTIKALADAGGVNSFYLDNSNSTFDSTSSFKDHSSTGHTITASGNVAHSTAVTKVNATSIKFDGSGDHLKWAQSGHADFTLGTGDWCIEGWFYRAALSGTGNYSYIIDFRYASNNTDRPAIYMSTGNNIHFDINGTKINSSTDPSMSTWFHLAVAKNSGTTTMYLNGTSVGTYSDSVDYLVGRPWLGDYPQVNSYCINGYMDEVRISKGNARYTGNFTPSTTPHTIDSDTVFLLSGVRNYGAGTDASSKSNHMLNSGATVTNHTPTSLNAVLNPLQTWSAYNTFSNGNRTATGVTSYSGVPLTIPVNMGGSNKWYMEFVIDAVDSVYPLIGVAPTGFNFNVANAYAGSSADSISYQSGGLKITGGSTSSYGASFAATDVIGMLITESSGTVQFFKQTSGSGSFADQGNIVTSLSGDYLVAVLPKPSAQLTLRIHADEWGNSSPPEGAKALTTDNLTAPSESNVDDHLNIQTWAGNATDGRAITTGFDTDWALIKRTNTTGHWVAADTCRGNGKSLYPHITDAETTDDGSGHVNTFTDTGVTVDDQARTNASGHNYWGMFLKAGGAPTATNSEAQGSAPTSGSYMIDGSASTANTIGTADITKLSVNTKLGFSCGLYNGSNSDTTLQTGLTDCKMIVIKRTNATYSWAVWHEGLTDNYNLLLDTNAAQVNSNYFDTSENTSTLFHLEGNSNATSIAGGTFVFWAFANTDYIKCGSYEGNSSTDGPFSYTGHRPEMVLLKSMDHTQSWMIKDAIRNPYNPVDNELYPDLNNGSSSSDDLDFLHNGMKQKVAGGHNSSYTYIYLSIGQPSLSTDKLEMTGR